MHIKVISEAQKKQLTSTLSEFLEPMYKKLNNYHLNFKIDLVTQDEEKELIYTQEDVYKWMMDKYPKLKTVVNELGLDLIG